MSDRRKIIVQIATSADGYIARPDGDFSWLNDPRYKNNYGMEEFAKSIDTVLWGRKTYEIGLKFGGKNLGMGPKIKNYVFTHEAPQERPEGIEFVNEAVGGFAKRLRGETGKNIWMMGGGGVIASFLDAGEIDEFSIHVIPILIGEGIPLVQPRHRAIHLELISTKAFEDGVVHLHYAVER
ncbi:MAG TPA: dihydrofolate reductase family protein [Candidatus Binatia bacterium]|nr:dihydrofolate reductase family protein [Candidatus Binatia bacterium]